MTDKEEIFLLLDDVFMKVDYKLRLKELVNNMDKEIEKLKGDKMEAYKAIVEVLEIQKKNYGHGMDLHLDMITFAEEQKQLKLNAEQYIEEQK